MLFRVLRLQALLDRLFDDGWCMRLTPEVASDAADLALIAHDTWEPL